MSNDKNIRQIGRRMTQRPKVNPEGKQEENNPDSEITRNHVLPEEEQLIQANLKRRARALEELAKK